MCIRDRYISIANNFAEQDRFNLAILESLKQYVYLFKEKKFLDDKKNFGRLSYSDNQNIGGSTDLAAALEHSTTDWSSSSSNSPINVDGGSFDFKTANGGHIDTYSNQCRISVGAGSGNPAMSDKLNNCSNMCVEGWYMYNGSGRDVLVSRYGSGWPNQWNHIVDPGGQFHFNSTGVGLGAGDRDWDAFGDDVWFHSVWLYNVEDGYMTEMDHKSS